MSSHNHAAPGLQRHDSFHTTQWSVVLVAGRPSSPEARRALELLCERYWYPLYAYVRRRSPDVNAAQDLTQAFFAELLEKNYVGDAVPERGRFRSFLLTACKHFLSKERDKAQAQKRGGGQTLLSLDFDSADSRFRFEPESRLTAEQQFDREWAITLLGRILHQLEQECDESGKGPLFRELKGFLVGDHSGTTYEQVAETLGMSAAAAKQAALRLRQRYRELLRGEIAETVNNPAAVDDEIRNLFSTLRL